MGGGRGRGRRFLLSLIARSCHVRSLALPGTIPPLARIHRVRRSRRFMNDRRAFANFSLVNLPLDESLSVACLSPGATLNHRLPVYTARETFYRAHFIAGSSSKRGETHRPYRGEGDLTAGVRYRRQSRRVDSDELVFQALSRRYIRLSLSTAFNGESGRVYGGGKSQEEFSSARAFRSRASIATSSRHYERVIESRGVDRSR